LSACIVKRPGKPDVTEYRAGPGKPPVIGRPRLTDGPRNSAADGREPRGKSLDARDIPGAMEPAARIITNDQPAVSKNTGSAAGTTPLSAGPRRRSPASTDRAKTPAAEEAGAIRLSIDSDGLLLLDVDALDVPLALHPHQVDKLASFLDGTRGLRGAT
jgi:hypothetical protein